MLHDLRQGQKRRITKGTKKAEKKLKPILVLRGSGLARESDLISSAFAGKPAPTSSNLVAIKGHENKNAFKGSKIYITHSAFVHRSIAFFGLFSCLS